MKYVRRLLWFCASRLFILSLVVVLVILAFYMSMNSGNIYILLQDGLHLRTSVILTREDTSELTNFFRNEFLVNDQVLNIALSEESPYLDYKINSFDYQLDVEWIWSWPWEDVAQATVVERVPKIAGSALSSKAELVKSGKMSATPPVWQSGRYNITLYRVDGRWKIASIVQTQILIDPTPVPTLVPVQPTPEAPAAPTAPAA